MAGCTAEDIWIDRLLVSIVLLVNAGLKRDEPILILIQCRVDGSCLGNKLVKLEWQKGVPGTLVLDSLINCTDPKKKFGEALATCTLQKT
jgi:hypothetical protein